MPSKLHKPSYSLIVVVFILVVFGLIMLSSASAVLSYENFGNNYHFFLHQLVYGVILGFLAMIVISKIDYHVWSKYATFLLLATVVLLVLVFIPGLGVEFGGAKRWIGLGPITIQPTEIAKLTFIMYLATWLEKRQQGITDIKYGLLPFLTIIGTIGLLILLQPDMSSMFIILLTAIIIYFVAGAPISHILGLGVGGIGFLFLLIKVAPYRMARFTVFLNPELDPQGIGYQINQALLAVGSGGIFGQGLGKSIQKYNYLPEATGDSIFAIIAEELGFVRVIFLIILYLVLSYVGFKIAKAAPDLYGRLLAAGIVSWIIFQAFINIAAIIALIPLTGIPLPFVSYGSSALLVSLAGMGILINISRRTKRAKQ